MNKPAFDPNQPFEEDKPTFDPNQPFEAGDQASSTQASFQSQPPNAGIEAIAQPIRDVGNAIAPYAQQVLSQPDVQPLKGLNPFTRPHGNPVQQVLGSARQVASLPFRYSATLGQLSQPVADFTAETLGKAQVNPYLSAVAGMAAGIGADPRSYLPVGGGMAREHPEGLPLKVAQAREARTGVAARDFQRLYKDPGAIFAGRNVEQAGANIGAAKAAAGIDAGVTNDIASLTPENLERINPTKTMKIEDINNVLGKISSGGKPTPQEAQNALDSVNSILSQPSVQNNRDVYRQWSAIKTHLNNTLEDVAPDVRAANKAYGREKLGQAFAPLNAVNKSGTPSKLAMLAKQIPGAVGGAIGGGLFGTGGAAAGYMAGKEAANLYHAPFIAGLQTAAGSAANQAINPILAALEKAGTSPQVQALMARYLQGQSSQ